MGLQSLGGNSLGQTSKMVGFFTDIPQGLVKIEQKSGEAWKKQAGWSKWKN